MLGERILVVARSQEWLAKRLGIVAPVQERGASSGSSARLFHGPPEKETSAEFPIREELKEAWVEARAARSQNKALTPMAVKQLYRVPAADWAFLGERRQPDKILLSHLKGKVRESATGAHTLQHGSTALSQRDKALSDMATSSVNLARPVSLAVTAIDQAAGLVDHLKAVLDEFDLPRSMNRAIEATKQCCGLALEALYDTNEGLARQNSSALRGLRESWVDASTLVPAVKRAALSADIPPGVPPVDGSQQFVAPVVGPALEQAMSSALEDAKRDVTLEDQRLLLARSGGAASAQKFTKKATGKPSSSQTKKSKVHSSPLAKAHQRETRPERPGYGDQATTRGRGSTRGRQPSRGRGRGKTNPKAKRGGQP